MKRRTFIQQASFLGAAAFVNSSVIANGIIQSGPAASAPYELPSLPFSYDALEPYIDAQTMEIHHSKHHAGYTKKLNAALNEHNLASKNLKEIFSTVSTLPQSVRNNGGGYYNHNLFWENLSPDSRKAPQGELAKKIDKQFGSFETFKEGFSKAAATQFGSGWAWLIKKGDQLLITSTPNQDNPLMDVTEEKGIPLLALDVWEHAYYLHYQNRRSDYIQAFWNVVNWDVVGDRFQKA